MSESLVLEHLRAIRGQMDSMAADIRDLRFRMTAIEIAMSGFLATEASHYASLAQRADRTDDRLERIERRLDLAAA